MRIINRNIPLSQSSLRSSELNGVASLVEKFQTKLSNAGVKLDLQGDTTIEGIIGDIANIENSLRGKVAVKPNPSQTNVSTEVLEALTTTKEFLLRLGSTPEGSLVTSDNESVALLQSCVRSLVGQTLTNINAVEYVPILSSEELIKGLEMPVTTRKAKKNSKEKKQAPKDEDLIKNQTPIVENQSSGGTYNAKKIPSMWKKFLEKQMLPIMPVIFANRSIYDMHELYEKTCNESCWSRFEIEERDLERSRMHHKMMRHESLSSRDKYTDKDSLLPMISYGGDELKQGIPYIPGFAPYEADCDGKKLTIERSLFGFYRLQDRTVCDSEKPIQVRYSPAPSLYYEEGKDDVKSKKAEFLRKLEEQKPQDFSPLPAEVSDEIIYPSKNASWRDQLRQMIIGLNLGYSGPQDFLRFDRNVGPYLSSHLASRRMGTCLHQAAIVSDMLSQHGKPNFLTLGRYIDSEDGHVQVWQYLPDQSRMLKIEPTIYSSELKKEHTEAIAKIPRSQEECDDEDKAYQLGELVRSSIPHIPYETGPHGSYDGYLFDDKELMHMHFMMKEISHENEMLWGKGQIPLRAALKKSIERFQQEERSDNLLELYFSRKAEINSKVAYREQRRSKMPQGPADIAIGLIRAAFKEDKVNTLDLQASYSKGHGYDKEKFIVGDLLLKCDNKELKHLGTSKSQLHEILRRSPVVINTVFKAIRDSYLSYEQRQKKYLSKASVSNELKDAEEFLEILNGGKISEYDPEQEPGQKLTLQDLCVSLIEIYALSNKVQDSKLKDKVITAWKALGTSFKHIPDLIDLSIFRSLKGEKNRDIIEGFLSCIKELAKSNLRFEGIYNTNNESSLTLSKTGASRFVAYWINIISKKYPERWNENSESFFKDFFESAEYLEFLQMHGMISDEVIHELSLASKDFLLNNILHERYKINPPIDEYPLSQLQLLEMMKTEYSWDKGIAPAILKLREIGVINNSYESPEGKSLELSLSDSYRAASFEDKKRPKRINHGQISYSSIDADKSPWWSYLSIPLEALVANCPQLRESLSPMGIIFTKYHDVLNYKYEEKNHSDYPHHASDSQRPVNYRRALQLWEEKYPESFRDFIAFVNENNRRNSVFWNKRQSLIKHCSISDQSDDIRLASSMMQLELMKKHFSNQTSLNQIKQEAKAIRRSIYQDIDTNASWTMNRSSENETKAAVVATGDTSWLDNVEQAIKNKEQYQSTLEYDTCARQPHALSASEKSLRALLINESGVLKTYLDIASIKNMAKQIAQEIKKRSPLVTSGNRQNGEQRGRRPSFDRTAEFSQYQELTIPEANKIDWKTYARTDRFYERKTTSSENRGETIIFNVGKLRSLAFTNSNPSNGYDSRLKPTELVRNILKTLLEQGRINQDTRFAIHSHGIPVAYFSLAELTTGQVPLLKCFRNADATNKSSELETPLERFITVLMVAQQLGEAESLIPIRKNSSLLESSSDKKRLYGQKITLVTETDSTQEDVTEILPLVKGQNLSVYRCNNDTLELSF